MSEVQAGQVKLENDPPTYYGSFLMEILSMKVTSGKLTGEQAQGLALDWFADD